MSNEITLKVALEIISHEGIVREAYRDSVGVWTWSIGITTSSGHKVYPRYKDKPQPMKHCLDIYLWLLKKKYEPKVAKVFKGHKLTEGQYAAALSFHWNTGRIHTASWPKLWKAGKVAEARKAIMNWKKPPEIIPRREKERNLFFDGVWSNDGKATEWKVKKPSYEPDWSSGKRVDITKALKELLG